MPSTGTAQLRIGCKMTLMQRTISSAHSDGMSEVDAEMARITNQAVAARRRLEVVPRISAEERREREEAVLFANASVGLEGFKVSAEAEARANRFIAGEIDLPEFLQGK